MRTRIATILNRVFRSWCWVDLHEWANRERKWEDIDSDCRDAEISGQPRCWCGKREQGRRDDD